MLCSVPTGRSGGSSWLDRLRSTKGFPSGEEDLDLDHFLSQNPSSASSNSPPPPISTSESVPPPQNRRRDPQWAAGVVSNVLSELFFVGGSAENSKLSGKKFPRKQTNPRLCVGSSDNGGGNGNSNSSFAATATAADQIRKSKKFKTVTKMKMKIKKKKMKMKKKRSDFAAKSPATVNSDSHSLTQSNQEIDAGVDSGDEEEEEEEEEELRGYSRSEVTVIDTSFEDWKAEKLVFRKKNVWKIRAKRSKSRISGKKKRKHGGDNHYHGGDDGQRLRGLTDSDNGDHQSLQKPSLDQNDSREEDCREKVGKVSPGKLGQHFKKRSKIMKMGGSSSSVVLVKGSKIEYKLSNFPKPTQNQHKN